MRISIFLAIFLVFLLHDKDFADAAKRQFAPAYCVRFKFDCSSPEKKGHVCCLYPLPVDGNGISLSQTVGTEININLREMVIVLPEAVTFD